jgi:hypothetical protein
MYLLLPPATMSEVLEQQPELLRQFVRGEPGAEEVLVDALLASAGELVAKWKSARDIIYDSKRKSNVYWIGALMIRQSIVRAGNFREYLREGGRRPNRFRQRERRGWQEIDATKKLRKGLKDA